jgi:hypothetical protein
VTQRTAVVVGCAWHDRGSELAFVTRSIAGAATRAGTVVVLVPEEQGQLQADGAFDLQALGSFRAPTWPVSLPSDAVVIVDELTPELADLAARRGAASLLYLSATGGEASQRGWRPLQLVGGTDPVGAHVPVNRLAEQSRHHGFGFTNYLLVLSDRTGDHAAPPPAAAWLSATAPEADVVVVEDAVASVWKGRALRGRVSIDTRTDLWRLLAHALVCIDLGPGPHIARECIEALRFGTPIVVPDGPGPAPVHARATGGATFRDASELLRAVDTFQNQSYRATVAIASREYAETRYGDPAALVGRVERLLGQREVT